MLKNIVDTRRKEETGEKQAGYKNGILSLVEILIL